MIEIMRGRSRIIGFREHEWRGQITRYEIINWSATGAGTHACAIGQYSIVPRPRNGKLYGGSTCQSDHLPTPSAFFFSTSRWLNGSGTPKDCSINQRVRSVRLELEISASIPIAPRVIVSTRTSVFIYIFSAALILPSLCHRRGPGRRTRSSLYLLSSCCHLRSGAFSFSRRNYYCAIFRSK